MRTTRILGKTIHLYTRDATTKVRADKALRVPSSHRLLQGHVPTHPVAGSAIYKAKAVVLFGRTPGYNPRI